MSTLLSNLTTAQLKRAVTIKEKIEVLENELAIILGAGPAIRNARSGARKRKRKMSPEAKEKIAAAQRARWARQKRDAALGKPNAKK